METKRVLSIIFSILFIVAFAFVLSWGIINFNKVKDGLSGTKLYTKEDIEISYEDGYNTALKNEENYTKQIEELRSSLELERFENINLKNDYENLILGINDNQIAMATFYFDSKIFQIIGQSKGTSLIAPIPESTNDVKFNYWELDGTQVDFNNFVLSENVTFNANITYCYEVIFVDYNNTVFNSQIIEENATPTLPDNTPTKENYAFCGYSLTQNGELVNLDELEITKDTVLYAVYKFELNGTYRFTDLIDTNEQDTVFVIDFTLDKGVLTNITSQNINNSSYSYNFNQLSSTMFDYSVINDSGYLVMNIIITFENNDWMFEYAFGAIDNSIKFNNGTYSSIIKI